MRRLALVAIAVAALSSPGLAQSKGTTEFGLDGNLSFGLDEPHITILNIPVQRLRVGYFISPRISIEPYGALNWTHIDGANSTNLALGVGGLYHFGDSTSSPRIYARPFAELLHNSIDGNNGGSISNTTGAIGAGVGVKIPFGKMFAWRFEGAFTQSFANGDIDAQSSLNAFFGLSFFMH